MPVSGEFIISFPQDFQIDSIQSSLDTQTTVVRVRYDCCTGCAAMY